MTCRTTGLIIILVTVVCTGLEQHFGAPSSGFYAVMGLALGAGIGIGSRS